MFTMTPLSLSKLFHSPPLYPHDAYPPPRPGGDPIVFSIPSGGAGWFRTSKNQNVSARLLARLFTRLFVLLTYSLAPH